MWFLLSHLPSNFLVFAKAQCFHFSSTCWTRIHTHTDKVQSRSSLFNEVWLNFYFVQQLNFFRIFCCVLLVCVCVRNSHWMNAEKGFLIREFDVYTWSINVSYVVNHCFVMFLCAWHSISLQAQSEAEKISSFISLCPSHTRNSFCCLYFSSNCNPHKTKQNKIKFKFVPAVCRSVAHDTLLATSSGRNFHLMDPWSVF